MNSIEDMLKKRVLGYVAFTGCVILFVFLVATIWEGRTVGWGKWIYEYQTLITGITAVGAAWLTIHQMKLSDRRQSSHAEAAMALTIRLDFLKVERLCSYALEQLEARAEDWKQFANSDELSAEKLFDQLLNQAWAFPDYWGYIKELTNDKLFKEAAPLFNSSTRRQWKQLRASIDELSLIAQFLFDLDQRGMDEKEIKDFFDDDFQFRADDVGPTLSMMTSMIRNLRHELMVLEANYRAIGNKTTLLRDL